MRQLTQLAIPIGMLALVLGAAGADVQYLLILAVVIVGGAAFAGKKGRWYPSRLFVIGLGCVVVGSTLRYEILQRVYGGYGDSLRYYEAGLARAVELNSFASLPFSPSYWELRGSRWGTGFIEQISGIVLSVIGESMRGEFLVFALCGFVGTYLIAKAYRWVNPVRRSLGMAAMVWMWPSVWYWPSSVGKEALILCAIGLTTYGYVGDGVRHRTGYLAAGIGLSFMIRPHVTAVLVVAIALAHVLAPWEGRLTNRRVAQIAGTAILSVVVLLAAVQRLGIADTDLEGIQEFAAAQQAGTLKGGSNIGAVSGPLAPLQAVVNVWSRPFPWEARTSAAAVAAGEIMLLWVLIYWRRRDLRSTWKWWRHNRLLRFAVPLLLGYTLMIGLTFGNLGIIARQRAPMFPMLLILIAGTERPASVPARSKRRGSGAPVRAVPATS